MDTSHTSEAQTQIAELNLLFLTLLEALIRTATPEDLQAGICGLGIAELRLLLDLDVPARHQLSAAPVALFQLTLSEPLLADINDAQTWMPVQSLSTRHAFALTALAGAWHITRVAPAWAGLAFGFDREQLVLLRGTPLSRLPHLASAAAADLAVRFASGGRFWPLALTLATRTPANRLPLIAAVAFHRASAEWVARSAGWSTPLPLRQEVANRIPVDPRLP